MKTSQSRLQNATRIYIALNRRESWVNDACFSVDECMDFDVDCTLREHNGETVLFAACRTGNITMMNHLFARDANVNIINSNGDRCMDIAIRKGCMGIVRKIAEHCLVKGIPYKGLDHSTTTAELSQQHAIRKYLQSVDFCEYLNTMAEPTSSCKTSELEYICDLIGLKLSRQSEVHKLSLASPSATTLLAEMGSSIYSNKDSVAGWVLLQQS
ncbi:hypothetical protein SARC_01144 [Sphaeroforma arctica JP610]|uniref:Uncharacterized protein n=1 Tax=Sphaeroforma arctica JP610 TaxID=667725 RepID=A0A0L0GCU1_9EUKA|nr:hypothetical protein SARC_01144 [Sphaeroforma arctica JP610]KNC86724.1 hypothetical protein SARC_01144 [Sphaeroforma arctica JP610]|eukprot:XP_014160626.1 hypothetical protein SARC_01144 [Sphaeroforma arctica JP610]